jgi:hypothetical protein
MLIASLGSIGAGLVWGWLLALLGGRGRVRPSLRDVLLLSIATVLLALQVLWFTNWGTLALFAGATTLALLLHLGWCQELRERAS